jgi:hypothetical protein
MGGFVRRWNTLTCRKCIRIPMGRTTGVLVAFCGWLRVPLFVHTLSWYVTREESAQKLDPAEEQRLANEAKDC